MYFFIAVVFCFVHIKCSQYLTTSAIYTLSNVTKINKKTGNTNFEMPIEHSIYNNGAYLHSVHFTLNITILLKYNKSAKQNVTGNITLTAN
jgi:hypothetical protein